MSLAYVATTCGMEARVEHWLDVSVRNRKSDSVVAGWSSMRAAELSLRGLFTTDRSHPERAVALLEEAVALEAAAGTPDHPIAMIGLAEAYGLAGRFEEAADIIARFWRERNRIPLSTSIALRAAGQLALFLEASGSSHELDRLLPEATAAATAAENSWGSAAAGPVTAMIRIMEGRRSYERGELAAAEGELARGLWFAELSHHTLWLVSAIVFTADLQLGTGDRHGARDALVRAREVVDTEHVSPFLVAWVAAAENRIGRSAARSATRAGELFEELTDRELSILRMLPGTATQREIGATLFLSINTVKGYNKSLYRKLGVGGRQEAVQAARQFGLI
ncbi:helix-turn-helix transcriptional regulator [Microbacterium sp.]|uniref:helix-turn-helix transcriptional regulator n=1 Tax=Microbacterium sp. TaxID=51671 RepID=UPI002E338588|nr:LuxR C-terminal-related transcriptional regulator [Microbacterium sp.]HEX5728315.1 LuxR C-terminal-related transcriptional regulator [Microbacterium sp.]